MDIHTIQTQIKTTSNVIFIFHIFIFANYRWMRKQSLVVRFDSPCSILLFASATVSMEYNNDDRGDTQKEAKTKNNNNKSLPTTEFRHLFFSRPPGGSWERSTRCRRRDFGKLKNLWFRAWWVYTTKQTTTVHPRAELFTFCRMQYSITSDWNENIKFYWRMPLSNVRCIALCDTMLGECVP